ncbi:hypothetical protein GCM10009744_03440 [Kribbella alba]|uniref:Uncharacterized protein n=1 Tax=Kribbella alba TaxID=190197 RepID=A0ABN2EWG9_9ACTN
MRRALTLDGLSPAACVAQAATLPSRGQPPEGSTPGRLVAGRPILRGGADFDLELIENRTLDGNTQELIYRPALH